MEAIMPGQDDVPEGGWVRVAALSELPAGAMMCVEPAGEPIAIYHLEDGTYCATDAICSHQYALLTDGLLEHDMVECPLHAAQFNVRNGKVLCEPAERDLKTYEVRAEDADIFLKL
jgi:nitrite reductase/ring-hydroxylating ferredoxin subunit